MDVAHNRSLGFAGKEILFRKIEFERYRKPQVVEYPRSAIVLNPQHTRQLKDELHSHHGSNGNGSHGQEEEDNDTEGERRHSDSDDDDDDDPRRIDKATLLCSDAQLRATLHLRWQNITPVGVGLVNLGNTCFANSVLQALAHTPAIAQYFMYTFRSADNQLGAPFDFAFALAETFRKMHPANTANRGGGGGAYRPGQIMSNLRLLSKHFSIGRQSDAHEFAVQLLFSCQKSLLHRLIGSKRVQPRVSHTTALYRICGGYLLSQVTWSRQEEIQQLLRAGKQQDAMDLKMEARQLLAKQEQQHRAGSSLSQHQMNVSTLCSNTYDPFTVLSVELAGHTLQHCLDKFCLAEELDGRCYHSPRDVGVRAKKKFTIHVPPPVLILHIKRFGPTGNKINKHVQFPFELDITRYCTPVHTSGSTAHAAGSSAASDGSNGHKRSDCQYALNAVCVHEGRSLNYGHYFTVAKATNGMWYEFNDSHVSRLSEDQLLRTQAYMLFYSRVPTASPSAAHGSSNSSSNSNRHAPPHKAMLANGVPSPNGTAAPQGMRPSMKPPIALAEAAMEEGSGIGEELTEAEVQAALEARRRLTEQSKTASATSVSAVQPHDERQKNGGTTAAAVSSEEEDASPSSIAKAERTQYLKRMRAALDTDSGDDDGEADDDYTRRMRPSSDVRRRAVERDVPHEDEEEEEPVSLLPLDQDEAASKPTTSSMYGGIIKSMKRHPSGNAASTSTSSSGNPTPQPAFRVGRHAVNALHTRKTQDTPDSVRRPTTAPKFQQRIRDPMWEMEMDKGKVKKVKSKEKQADPFEGTNPFQEVSRGMFDIRGRRHRA